MPAEHRPEPPRLPLPDPRRALSDMRSAVRLGYGLVRDGLDHAPLPPPVAAITGSVLRKVDGLAHHADAVARTVVHTLLGPSTTNGNAAALAASLGQVVAAPLRINDDALRTAAGAPATDPDAAARLMARLLDAGAVRPAGREASAALFAVVLSHMTGPADAENLSACRAIADAITDEITAAGSDPVQLARLLAEFRDHV